MPPPPAQHSMTALPWIVTVLQLNAVLASKPCPPHCDDRHEIKSIDYCALKARCKEEITMHACRCVGATFTPAQ